MTPPIYTPENCNPAYQLNWSYCIFWRRPPESFAWFDALKRLNEKDHIRLLQHTFERPNVSKFLVSTRPEVAPQTIAQRVKGRLQHLIRDTMPDAFQRNYSIRSIGSTRREKLDNYLAIQLQHHPMADAQVDRRLRELQHQNPKVDLSESRRTSHAIYWYNLHLVFVNVARAMEIRSDVLDRTRDMILRSSKLKQHRLSRAAILPDHMHLPLGCRPADAPQSVALAYMNNLAYAHGMRPIFEHGYYVGTFGEYDLGVIPGPLRKSPVPPSKLGGDE